MNYTLQNLDVYREAEFFSNEIWEIIDIWNYFLKDTIR